MSKNGKCYKMIVLQLDFNYFKVPIQYMKYTSIYHMWLLYNCIYYNINETLTGSMYLPMSCFNKYILVIAENETEHKIKYNIHSMEIYI